MTVVNSFTCFPRLPPELRSLIFDLALPGPRIITLFVQPGSPACTIEATASHTDILNYLYFTCKESHTIMRTRYRSFLHPHISQKYPVWIDTCVDTLYVPNIDVLDIIMRPNGRYTGLQKIDLGPIRYLAFEAPILPNRNVSNTLDPDLAQWQFAAIKCFPQLHRVIFIPTSVGFNHKFAGQLVKRFRHRYRRYGDVLEVQDKWDPDVLGPLEFEFVDYEDFVYEGGRSLSAARWTVDAEVSIRGDTSGATEANLGRVAWHLPS